MVSKHAILEQLKKIKFKSNGWGRSEVAELPNIILEDEEIYECVNGMYEGGFALLVASDTRVLLVDKKPLSFLTVEDMRFDMISQMDYNHRLLGAEISISAGDKNLRFRSYNKIRLRKLIGHVQNCMAEVKKNQSTHQYSQVQHLEQINHQLQAYLVAQQEYQADLQRHEMDRQQDQYKVPDPPKPSHELADYLYAQSLLNKYSEEQKVQLDKVLAQPINRLQLPSSDSISENFADKPISQSPLNDDTNAQLEDIYNEGVKEIFGKVMESSNEEPGQEAGSRPSPEVPKSESEASTSASRPFYNISPLHIAYSKLPMALRNRKFGHKTSYEKSKSPNPKPSEA